MRLMLLDLEIMKFDKSLVHLLALACLLVSLPDVTPLEGLQWLSFSTTPKDTTFMNTGTAKIVCKATGRKPPRISWLSHDGKPVGNITGIRNVLPDGGLVFHPFSQSNFMKSVHDCKYRCKAENSDGVLLSAAVNIRAVVDVKYSPEAFHQSSFIGGSAVFSCTVPSAVLNHVSVVSWSILKHSTGEEIVLTNGTSKNRFHAIVKLGNLVIENVEKEDEDVRVKCTTKDELNGLMLSSTYAFLFIQDAPTEGLVFLSTPKTQAVNVGEPVVLSCVVNAPYKPTYTWFKNGEKLYPTSRYQVITSGVLLLRNAENNDGGHYKCFASSGNITRSKSMNVTVQEKIKFIKTPENQLVQVGQSTRFSCKVSGSPSPSLKWFKDGELLSASERIRIDKSVLSTDLMLHMVSQKDEGIYQCIATNRAVEQQASAQLIVGAVQPTIIEKPAARQILQQDQSINLHCKATGQPLPDITWYVDGKEVKQKARFSITSLELLSGRRKSTLKIDGLRMSDGGIYQCKAENKAGISMTKSNVAITGAPTIVNFKDSINAVIGKPVYLHCNAKGFPLPTFRWLKDGWRNIATDNQYVILENGTLLISSVSKMNKGPFKCEAKNNYGQDQKSLMLNVLVPPTIAPFTWASIEAGHRTSKTCEVPTGDLPIHITWFWNGKVIKNGGGVSVDTKDFLSHLIFSEVKAEHRGKYTCKAENKAGYATFSEELVVNEPPRLLESPVDISVLKPARFELRCRAAGFPTPQIVWYKNVRKERARKLLALSNRIRQFRNGSLFVTSTSADDSGKYTCSAENGIGKIAERIVTIDIKVPATVISTSPKTVSQRIGKSIQLNCSATGTPVLQAHWYQSSKVLSDSNKYVIQGVTKVEDGQSKLESVLKISNLQRSDNGNYLCQATNSFGGDKKEIRLKVLERPDPPARPTSTRTSSRWLEIKWRRPYNGHCRIIKYSLQYTRQFDPWMQKNVVSVDGNLTKFVVAGVSPGLSYNFRIIATNRIGNSAASAEAVFQTKEEAPSSPPMNVTVSALSKDKLMVVWKPPPKDKKNGKILGYEVTCKDISDPMRVSKTLTVYGSNMLVLNSLKAYTFYLITIRAFTKPGAGPQSTPVRKRTLEGAPTAPPQSVSATAISSQIISVKWNLPPYEHRHGMINGYKVIYTEVTTSKKFSTVVTSVHYAELTKLKKYTVYEISVLAFTGGGDGKLSDPIMERTAEDVPGPPGQLRAAAASPHQILVTWKPPSEPNGMITGYILHYRKSMDGSSSQYEFPLDSNISSQTLHDLEVGKEYEIWINAQTKIGTGFRSGIVKARTMTKIPARILTLTQIVRVSIDADIGLPCVAVGHPKPEITWIFKNQRIKKRRRRKRAYQNEGKLILNNVQMNNAGPYNCSAVNPYGSDWNIITLIVQGFPSVPRMIQAKTLNETMVNISWVSSFDAHSPIIRYHIRFKERNNTNWKTATLGPDQQWFILKIGSKNQSLFSVASENIIGKGKYSSVIEITRTRNGFVTKVLSDVKTSVVHAPRVIASEKENVIAPIIAGCVVAVVVVAIIMALASWDRTERRLRAPRCDRLFICDTGDDYAKGPYRGTYDGPYNEPNMPWPWNATGNSFVGTNEDTSDSTANQEESNEDRFPEHLFAQLLNFDETDEDTDKNIPVAPKPSQDLLASDVLLGRSSSTTYKTSQSSQLSKNPFNDSSLLSSRNEPSTTDSEQGGPAVNIARSLENALSDVPTASKHDKLNSSAKMKHGVKSLDRGLHQTHNIQAYISKNGNVRNQTIDSARENRLKTIGSKPVSVSSRDGKVKRSKSVRSYESVSSNCSSTRGELVKAYEFGRKYKLQEYFVPTFLDNSTTEDSCSELSELCEFSSLPRDTNDCLLRMPIPIRPLLSIEDSKDGLKEIGVAYDGESLV